MSTTSVPAPLHDIVGPVTFFPYTLSEIIVGIGILFLLLGALFYWILRRRQKNKLTPREAALQALASLKKELMTGSDHDFGIHVSTLVRNYLNEVLGLAAPRQTTEEFLLSLQRDRRFSALEQEALSHFLCQSDVLKFAQGIAGAEERLALVSAAESFIQQGEKEGRV